MSKPEEKPAKKFVNELSEHLKKNRLKEALSLFQDNANDTIVQESSWDIVPIVSSYLSAENAKNNVQVIESCEAILNIVAEKCNPSEVVLELLEQVDSPNEDVKFCAILKALRKSFDRMPDKAKTIEWCVGTLRSYVDDLTESETEKFEAITNRIDTVYNAIMLFLEHLVKEAALTNVGTEKCVVLRGYLLSILLYLLGKLLCYFQDQTWESDLELLLTERIIFSIMRLSGDLFWFLDIINMRCRRSNCMKRNNAEEQIYDFKTALFESTENVPDQAYANLYFHTLSRRNLWERMPQIYHPLYIFEACIYLVNNLLQGHQYIINKGLSFMDELLRRMGKRTLTAEVLELNIYSKLFNTVVNVMIYSDSNKQRKRALHSFREYLEIFNMEARYMIILHLYQTSEHSGFLSLITSITKASIIECLQTSPHVPYFLGSNFKCLLKQACKLPHGSTSDLVELSDEVITSLNLLRFLFIRDKDNETGIWNMADELDKDYLKPLREGIYMCRAHWKVKTKDLDEQKHTRMKKYENVELGQTDTEVSLFVGGQKLPQMPVLEKISLCHQALNGLDVMESVLIRVNECIVNNPLKMEHNKVKT